MLYGRFTCHPLVNERTSLDRLKKTIQWAGAVHYQIDYGNFSGGFFLDPRLPHTVDDFLYVDTTHGLLILMMGSVYNRMELCHELKLPTNTFSDPALVAYAYLQEGPGFVNKFNGDFSILIYQSHSNAFHLFRDHVGVAPLAYTTTEQSIYFSSDITGLCRTFYEGGRINMDPLLSDVKVIDMTLTFNEKVLKLKAGHFLTFDEGKIITKKYWEPERVQTDKTLTQERMFSELKSLLEDAVHIRSDQRFNAGAHLSGGLDSSTVAALARKEYGQQPAFYGYSWSPISGIINKNELDERELVKQTGEMAGIVPAFIHVEVSDFVELTKNSISSFTYFHEEKVLKMAKLHGTNLIFSGWGGDEFISYGSLGVDYDLFFNFQWNTFFKKNPFNNPRKVVKYLIFRVFLPAINYIPGSAKKRSVESLRFFNIKFSEFHQQTYQRFYRYHSRRNYQLGLLNTYHLSERTECWSITGYKNGVEYRYPLLDKRIIEYILKVPSKLLVNGSKYTRIILREISDGLLPESVRWRIGKSDDAFFAYVSQQSKDRGLLFIHEINEFKANPHLDFINFNALEQEVKNFKESKAYSDPFGLFGYILSFKSLHEFTKSYQEKIEP